MGFFGFLGKIASAAAPVVGTALMPGLGTLAGGLIGSGISGLGSQASVEDDRNYQQQLWDKQNAYNTPAAQKQRMLDAGLNPNIATAAGSLTSGSAAAPVSSVPGQTDPNKSLDFLASMMNAMVNMNLMNSQKNLNDSAANLNNSKVITESTQQNLNLSESDKNVASTALIKLQSINQDIENNLLQTYGGQQKAAEINSLVTQAAKNEADAKLTLKNIDVAASQIVRNYAEAHNLNVNSKQVLELLPYAKSNLAAQIAGKLIENSLGTNELNWQNSSNGNSTNYGVLRNLDLMKNRFGAQQLKGESSITDKNDTFYWLDKLLDIFGTGAGVGAAAKFMMK